MTFDVALAAAVLSADRSLPSTRLEKTVLLGELALDRRARPVRGVLPAVLAAKHDGRPAVVVPTGNLAEAALVGAREYDTNSCFTRLTLRAVLNSRPRQRTQYVSSCPPAVRKTTRPLVCRPTSAGPPVGGAARRAQRRPEAVRTEADVSEPIGRLCLDARMRWRARRVRRATWLPAGHDRSDPTDPVRVGREPVRVANPSVPAGRYGARLWVTLPAVSPPGATPAPEVSQYQPI